jgi:hypothetical protein
MHDLIYAYANHGASRAGLGNLLVSWAKCEVFARDHHCPVIAPQWSQPKIGPILRREKDLRYYLGIFRHRPDYVRGLRRLWLLARLPRIDAELVKPEDLASARQNRRPIVVNFHEIKRLFEPLLGHEEFVARQIKTILSPRTQRVLTQEPRGEFIAAHVRRGDKPLLPAGEPFSNRANWALPEEWFIHVIESIRKKLGRCVPVRVFSDGWPEQLRKITALPEVTLAQTKNAGAEILLLTRARALISGGTSTFSAWGAYLAHMPTIWFPSVRQEIFWPRNSWDFDTDVQGNFSDAFVDAYIHSKPAELF